MKKRIVDGTIENPIIYYIRQADMAAEKQSSIPIVTVALAKYIGEAFKEEYCRGIAICSPSDNPDKSVGRHFAIKRMRKAFHSGNVSMKIREDWILELIIGFHDAWNHPGSLVYKSAAPIKPKKKEWELFVNAERRYNNYDSKSDRKNI
jgi:hypothetical protein